MGDDRRHQFSALGIDQTFPHPGLRTVFEQPPANVVLRSFQLVADPVQGSHRSFYDHRGPDGPDLQAAGPGDRHPVIWDIYHHGLCHQFGIQIYFRAPGLVPGRAAACLAYPQAVPKRPLARVP